MGTSADHAPPVPSPLSGPWNLRAMHFGSINCIPKCCYLISRDEARQIPDLLSSIKHSYRFTTNGIQLIAEEGKMLLGHRIHPNDVRFCHWSPSSLRDQTKT